MIIVLGVLSALVSLFVLPNDVVAWRTGAEGEVETARTLEPLTREGFVILHDRRVPGRRENIDHIVIGPPGVFVVETKNYAGPLRMRGKDLYINGRRRTGFVDQVTRQADTASMVLHAPVGRLIVVHRADFPLFGRRTINGVAILESRSLTQHLRKAPVVFDPRDVDRVARDAAKVLRSAS